MRSKRRVLIALDLPLAEGFGESAYVRGTAESLREKFGDRWELAIATVSTTEQADALGELPDVSHFRLKLDRAPVFGAGSAGRRGDPLYADLEPDELDLVQRQLHAGLAEAVREFEPDVLHVHHAFLLVPAAAVLGAIWSFPFVVTAHGTDTKTAAGDRRFADIIGPSLRRASGVTAVSAAVRRELGDLFGPRVARGADVVPGGVDVEYFKPAEGLAAFDDEHGLRGQKVVLFVGPLTPAKGVDTLLRAAELVDAQFCLVGKAAESRFGEFVERRAEQLGKVRVLKNQPKDELRKWYSRADVVVMPSRDEGFGLVALEAMACGSPVVVTRSPAMEGVVTDGLNGYIVERGQVNQLAVSIDKVLEDPEHDAMRAAARSTVGDRYSWPSVVELLEPVYHRALGPAQPFALA